MSQSTFLDKSNAESFLSLFYIREIIIKYVRGQIDQKIPSQSNLIEFLQPISYTLTIFLQSKTKSIKLIKAYRKKDQPIKSQVTK